MKACLLSRRYLVAMVGLALSASGLARAEGRPTYYVLAIGVNKYKTVSPLGGAVNDAKQIADLFKRQGARTVRLLTDEEATCGNVVGALMKFRERTPDFKLKEEVRPGEVVVIYMAGHGLRSGGKWWFAPHDFDGAAPPYNTTLVQDTQILAAASELMDAGHRVVLILDCCFAGQIRHSIEWNYYVNVLSKVDDQNAKGGLVLLSANVPSQTSKEGPEHGRFTQALLEALGGKADRNGDKQISLREVNDYLAWRLRELAYKRPKFPGLNWSEQDHLTCATPSVPDTFVLTSGVEGKPLREREDMKSAKLFPVPTLLVKEGASPPVGVWKQSWKVEGPEGKEFQVSYVLALRKDGTYRAEVRDALGNTQLAAGNYLFEPGRNYGFRLDYDTGSDWVRLDSATDDELKITVYSGPISAESSWELRRVKAR